MDARNPLKDILLFKSLQPEDSERLVATLRRRMLKKGEVLFRKGDEGSSLFIVKRGTVKIVLPTEMGDEVTPAILTGGDVFGEMALLDGMPRSADAVALEDTELLVLGRKNFLDFLRSSEQSIQAVLSYLTMRLRKTDDLLEDACFLTVSIRLAKRLVELARNCGTTEEGRIKIDLHLTQKDLAAMVGATRESVNKEISVLRRKGVIRTSGKTIEIIDLKTLEKRGRLY
ncbi:MAG: Crp/Fnr family transcriptional regulator [Deltaproteobacteria bacterium]|nr:Crp/Fnr family transcriptional regulator [Deltaproteobacteria bacterium]